MKVQDVLNELDIHPSILHSSIVGPLQDTAFDSLKKLHIRYARKREDVVTVLDMFLYVENYGEANEEAFYATGKPSILKVEERSPYFTNEQYKSGIESEFPGFSVIQLKVRVEDSMDVLTVKADDGTNVVEKRIGVWKDSNNNVQYKIFG